MLCFCFNVLKRIQYVASYCQNWKDSDCKIGLELLRENIIIDFSGWPLKYCFEISVGKFL